VTQVLSSGKRHPMRSPDLSLSRLSQEIFQLLSRPEVYKWGRWSLASFGATLMFSWDWKLVVATGVGIGGMGLVYLASGKNWQQYWLLWQPFLKGSQGKLTLAVGSGAIASLSTYLAAAIWAESDNRWLATGTVLEGMGTLLTLTLLGWHILSQQNQDSDTQLEKYLHQLTEPDPIKRLIAVRQLIKLQETKTLPKRDRHQIEDYFHLLLQQESEKLIRQAILEHLHLENSLSSRPTVNTPLNVPLNIQESLKRVKEI
jgi:hypothetical protein